MVDGDLALMIVLCALAGACVRVLYRAEVEDGISRRSGICRCGKSAISGLPDCVECIERVDR